MAGLHQHAKLGQLVTEPLKSFAKLLGEKGAYAIA